VSEQFPVVAVYAAMLGYAEVVGYAHRLTNFAVPAKTAPTALRGACRN
jgi:hypothetical protein